jgi:hypothetical protein
MPGIFEALPGIEAPVGAISKGLAEMWEGAASEAGPRRRASTRRRSRSISCCTSGSTRTPPTRCTSLRRRSGSRGATRAGSSSSAPSTTTRASPRCARRSTASARSGKSPGDTRCCEFVMLSYPRWARANLENQVSVCLSTDIPLYYWAHRFSESAKLADYRYLLTTARRVLIDSATAPADAIGYAWPKPENVRDLAYARLLPVRQSIGQFLSKFPAAALTGGLKSVTLEHGADLAAEARPPRLGQRPGQGLGRRRAHERHSSCRGAGLVRADIRLRRREGVLVDGGHPRRQGDLRRRLWKRPHGDGGDGRASRAGERPQRGDVLLTLSDLEEGVAALALPKEDVAAEEQVAEGDRAGRLGNADVVQVDPAALDVLAACPFEGLRPLWTRRSVSALPAASTLDFSRGFVGISPATSLKRASVMPSRPPPNMISLALTASSHASCRARSSSPRARAPCGPRGPPGSPRAAPPAPRSRPAPGA